MCTAAASASNARRCKWRANLMRGYAMVKITTCGCVFSCAIQQHSSQSAPLFRDCILVKLHILSPKPVVSTQHGQRSIFSTVTPLKHYSLQLIYLIQQRHNWLLRGHLTSLPLLTLCFSMGLGLTRRCCGELSSGFFAVGGQTLHANCTRWPKKGYALF